MNFYLNMFPGVFPWTERFFESNNLKRLKEGVRLRDEFIGKQLKRHQETYESENVRDFCDSLIKSVREDETRWKVCRILCKRF